MHRRLLSAAATTALLLGLAACSEPTDGPVTTAPPSIDISAPSDGGGEGGEGSEPSDGGGEKSAEPTAEAPDIPPPDPADYAGMTEHSPEGAEQAFRYYIAVLYWGYQTGSSDEVEALQGPTCSECSKLVSKIDKIDQGGTYWRQIVLSDKGSSTTESENYDIEVGFIYVISEDDNPTATSDKHTPVAEQAYTARGGMYWIEGHWVVGGIDISETIHDL